ncbi:MAG: IPT/TIG domain-containing protein [Blastocatellia bacterium]
MKSDRKHFIKAFLITLSVMALLMIVLARHSSPAAAAQSRDLHVLNNTVVAGQSVNVVVELTSLGNENALGFSLNFNPAIFSNPIGTPGSGVMGAMFNLNSLQAASGRIGVTIALGAGQSLAAGTRQIAVITFAVAANAPAGAISISFGDQPVFREISDPNANPVTATFTPGTVTIQQPNPVPTLTSLTPPSSTAGSSGIALTINGSNFVPGSEVRWNGSPRTTAFVSSTQLTATIPASDLAIAGTVTVTVVNPAPGGGASNSLTFTTNNPAPAITSLSPNAVTAGGAAFTLTINGSGFVPTSSVWWNGSSRGVSFISATQLTTVVPASDIAAAGTATVVVMNPSPGGGSSQAATFTINNPFPTIVSLNPNGATAGGAAFTLTVNGIGFVNGSTVQWNGGPRTTAFVGTTQLTVTIPASDIATAGTGSVSVINPAPGGGTSNAVSFTISQAQNPVPTITSISPLAATAGGAAFMLTVNGTNFVSGATVQWNGSARPTTFVSAMQLTAAIPASDIATTGTATVTVVNPAPGGGTSAAATFQIGPAPPTITLLSPNDVLAGASGFLLDVIGNGFVDGSVLQWNGSPRATRVLSATQLVATIPAIDLVAAGTASIRVVNPAVSGGTSAPATFTISQTPVAQTAFDPPAPTINDDITVRLSGTWPNGCVPQNPRLISISGIGAEVKEVHIATSNSGQVCTAALTDWSLSLALGKLVAGSYVVRTFHTSPSGQREIGRASLTVSNPVPVISSLGPSSAPAGGRGFTLVVNGTNFVIGSTVLWNGSPRPSTLISQTILIAQIPVSDITSAGTASVTVINPAPSSGTSNALSFAIHPAVASVSAASFLGSELAPESIVAAFGLNLATSVEIANTVPLPTTLAGTKVTVRDRLGSERLAPLFFVAPTQVNFQIPAGVVDGVATVTITSGDGKTSAGEKQIAVVAPGLFTASATGQGPPAATVLRLKANGQQSFEPLARFDAAQNKYVLIPIDLGPEGEQVFIILFGTGFRFNNGLASVGVKIGGTDSEVLYAGVAPDFVGLDQSNVRIPRSLIGRGEVDLVMTVNGKVANTVRINIK